MSIRRKLTLAAGAEVLVIAAVFAVFAAASGPPTARARRALTLLMMAEAVAVTLAPLFAAGSHMLKSYRRALLAACEPAGWVLATSASGAFLLAVIYDRGALAAWLVAKLVCAAAGLAGAALVLALARLSRRPMPACALAGALVLVFALQPLYSFRAIRAFERSRPRAHRLLISLGVRSPPMAAAYALSEAPPTEGAPGAPHMWPGFYHGWVGSYYRVKAPSSGRYMLECLLAAAALAALAALRPARKEGTTELESKES